MVAILSDRLIKSGQKKTSGEENERHRKMQVERDSWRSPSPPSVEAGLTSKLDKDAQGLLQPDFENLQRWSFQDLSGQLVPALSCLHGKGPSPYGTLELSLFQIVKVAYCPSAVHFWKERVSTLSRTCPRYLPCFLFSRQNKPSSLIFFSV